MWPFANSGGVPTEFGSAVAEAVDLLTHLDSDFPNFNLDSDRGLAYFTWQCLSMEYTNPLAIVPET
jgi:hypothetical protein